MAKKVAQLVTLSEMGGAQKHVLLLSRELKSQGYEVTVFTSYGGKLINKLRESEIKVELVPDMVREINIIKDIKAVFYLYKKFKEEKYDIVHCHSSKAGILGRTAAFLAGIKKIVYTAHGFVFNEPMSSLKRLIYVNIERVGAAFGDKIIAVSKKDCDSAIENKISRREKLIYVPNALPEIDKSELRDKSELKAELNINQGEFVLGTISNFYETKGHVYLIDALKRLYDEGYSFVTVFAGEGPKLQEMKELSKDYNIKFLGYREDNYDIINLLDLFVLPSIKEGMPYVILEAMGLGKPVLCTKVGALTDIISEGKNGYILEPGNSNLLYDKIKWILENKTSIDNLGIEGKRYVEENFSMKAFTEAVTRIYQEE